MVLVFSVNYETINANYIINTHKYLMEKYEIAWIHQANVYCFDSDANRFWYIIAQKCGSNQ